MGGGSAELKLNDRTLSSGTSKENDYLWGIVDMGSDLTPPTSRILPTVYQYRNGTSLYEVQYDDDGKQIPIPQDVIESIIAALLRFQIFCMDFKVPSKNIRVLATEATRKAINADEFLQQIKKDTGLTVELLPREEEGAIGAWGIASSFADMHGLVMDLGGGSTQITWMITERGKMQTSNEGAFSFPYGAAALTQRLAKIDKGTPEEREKGRKELREEMKRNFLHAYNELDIPDSLVDAAKRNGGYQLYLSGGGFRGWGYLLLYQDQKHGHSYPISIINGYTAHKAAFEDTEALKRVAKEAEKIFRVSDRRRAQVPAVALLVNVLAEIIPHGIRQAHFCQGGVREGFLFRKLPSEIRGQRPIEIATSPYARPLSRKIAKLLRDALPKPKSTVVPLSAADENDGWEEIISRAVMRQVPESFTTELLKSMANMLYVHSDMSKELSSTAALYSTSTGLLSDTHGVSHVNRALLALMLESRYEGDVPPREDKFRAALRKIVSPAEVWWTGYLGTVALVLSRIYPAGTQEDIESLIGSADSEAERDETQPVSSDHSSWKPRKRFRHKKPHMRLSAHFSDTLGKDNNKSGLKLVFHLKLQGESREDPMKVQETLASHAKEIKKVGKKKHWIPIGDGEDEDAEKWGMKVEVEIKAKHPADAGAGIV